MSQPYSKTFKKGKKKGKKRKPKSKNQAQDRRIKKLEDTLYPSIEYKTKDINSYNVSVSNGGYANYPMIQIAQGDGSDQRVGDKCTLQSLRGNLSISRADTSNIMRIIIAATPSSTHLTLVDVLQYSNHGVYGPAVFSSPYRLKAADSEKTYKILFDKVYVTPGDIATVVDKFECDLKGVKKQLEFTSVGATQPNNMTVSLLAISDSTGVGHPVLDLNLRCKYFDL